MIYLMESDSNEMENIHNSIDNIFSEDEEKCYESVLFLKNIVIGNNRQKENVIETGIIPRLLQLLINSKNECLCYEIAATICSLSKGSESTLKVIIDAETIPVLIKVMTENKHQRNLINICLRSLRSIYKSNLAPVQSIYDANLISYLLTLVVGIDNWSFEECVTSILAQTCQTTEQQNMLCNYGAIQIVSNFLLSSTYKVKIPALLLLSQMGYQNETVAIVIVSTVCEGKDMPDILADMMSQERNDEMQLASAKCMTNLFRAGALESQDTRIAYKTLPTLARLCKQNCEAEIRASAADTLSYLTEVDTDLQRITSICYHIIPTVADFFKCQTTISLTGFGSNFNTADYKLNETSLGFTVSSACKKIDQEHKCSQDMKIAAFKLFASLGANDEEIRKKIIETDMLMDYIINGLSDANKKIRLAALRCLHSLSRSVQQLRTTFQDHAVWVPLRNLLHGAPDDILTVASSTLCNLLLESSPSKQHFLDRSAVDLLCNLTKREETTLRLNGVWALTNMAFQAEQSIKMQILTSLGIDQIFHLLEDDDSNILIKTLGLIRNLLTTKPHIDHIMNLHGVKIIEGINIILDGNNTPEVKEQALCVLANVADGITAKDYIMSNEDLVKKLSSYLMHCNVELQIASVICITNLIWKDDDGSTIRQAKFKEMGVQKILQNLMASPDTSLFDKVKTASQQFQ